MPTDLGVRLARTVAAQDANTLKELLAPRVNFRALTPGQSWESDNPDTVVDDVILGSWFPLDRPITGILAVERVGYRFQAALPDSDFIVEQASVFQERVRQDLVAADRARGSSMTNDATDPRSSTRAPDQRSARVGAALAAWGASDRNDPFPLFAEVRALGPVHPVTLTDGHDAWLVVGHDEVRQALNDPRLSKDMHAALALGGGVVAEGLPGPELACHMLAVDPPDHTRFRRLVSAAFSTRRVEALRPRVQLARIEGKLALRSLFGGFPRLRLAGDRGRVALGPRRRVGVARPVRAAGHSRSRPAEVARASRETGLVPSALVAMRSLTTDYLVVGAGAMGMAFTDALIDHADVHVTLVDHRHAAGGHWQDAYPFVQLHQASQFYGVPSTLLGTGALQHSGPEAGLQERARRSEIQQYYDVLLYGRFLGSGRVTFLGGSEYHADGAAHFVTCMVSGQRTQVEVRRRIVDATYLSPTIPATTAPPFEVVDGARVVAVNDLASLAKAPGGFVVVGSGKTATDAIVWLLKTGVPSGRITWVRPREPWMLNRAAVQPDPVVALTLATDTMASATEAESLDDMFLRLEAAGVMLRIDTGTIPTMAKAPTLGTWELDLLRTVERVVRLGHMKSVTKKEIVLDGGAIALDPGSLVVHCAASGLRYPPMVPIWQPDKIRLQTIRAGFPCFGAALAGFVEATRDDDRERNRLCPPNVFSDSSASWVQMQVRGTLASRTFGTEPDIDSWANGSALNPARMTAEQRKTPAVEKAAARLAAVADRGLSQMIELANGRSR